MWQDSPTTSLKLGVWVTIHKTRKSQEFHNFSLEGNL
jgi:hypothetical protein